ncbi:MAG: hypothetical protein QW051_01210 [Candidatus Aenigmatarchaeota archaeon]
MKKSKQIIKIDEWFKQLTEEIKAIIAVKTFNANVEFIEGKWLIGKTIEEALKDLNRAQIYGKKINQQIAEAVGLSEREIYRCRQFYNLYPYKNFDEVVRKINAPVLNWKTISNMVLPSGDTDTTQKPKEYISVRIDEENKILYIKEKYKDYKIRYYS